MMIKKMSILAVALFTATSAFAIEKSEIGKKKHTDLNLYATASEAYDMLKADENAIFIDVRTRAEVNFLGMPTDATIHIPYMTPEDWAEFDEKKKVFKLFPNSDFAIQVAKLAEARNAGKDTLIFTMCRSGGRSAKAVNLLAKMGYTNVYNIVDGYEGDKAKEGPTKGQRTVNGWKNSGLPWSYKLDIEKMYDVD